MFCNRCRPCGRFDSIKTLIYYISNLKKKQTLKILTSDQKTLYLTKILENYYEGVYFQ